jgi:hypothetical protein
MSDDMPFDEGNSFPSVQFAFFSKEGGQWVFRGTSVADVHELLNELLALADETDGPGILSTIQSIKAAGLIKDAAGGGTKQSGSSGGSSSGGNGIPAWLQARADELGGDPKTGTKNGRTWYAVKVGDDMKWQQAPKG